MILIITEAVDPHADQVAQKLFERGADFVRVNPAQFPTLTSVSLSYGAAGQFQGTLRVGNQTVDLHLLDAVWCRRLPRCVPHETVTDEASRVYLEEECSLYLQDVWNLLTCLCVPASPPVIQRAALKASQLKLAGALGFELPPTLFTNNPDEFLQFYRQYNGHIVSKAAGKSFFRSLGETFGRYTQVVSKRDVGYARAVRFCPMIFQAYVPKLVELRITVVGESVFAAEIHSQVSNHTRDDWRHYDWSQTPYFQHALPSALEQRCVQLVQQLGLCYGAIDMVLTPDRRYVFLEINPGGQYFWIERATGLPISDAICDLLLSGSAVHKPVQGGCHERYTAAGAERYA
jgi:MvdD pre-ATP grasp domain